VNTSRKLRNSEIVLEMAIMNTEAEISNASREVKHLMKLKQKLEDLLDDIRNDIRTGE